MELKDFIKTVLIDVTTGIEEASNAITSERSLICPAIGHAYVEKFNFQVDGMGRHYQKIEFDVAVTAEEKNTVTENMEGKAGIKVLSFSTNTNDNASTTNSTVSRVKFHVPIALKSNEKKGNT
jgi:hypothetical protein